MTILICLPSPLSIGLVDHIRTNVGRRGRFLATVLSIYAFTLLAMLILWPGRVALRFRPRALRPSGVSRRMGLIQFYRVKHHPGAGIVWDRWSRPG